MDYDDYESLPTSNFGIHMTAGAIAGVLEHCIMYPLDSVKTRMQSLYHAPPGTSIWGTFTRMVQQEGILRPMRGLSAVVMGAGPAHAFYFASYEYMKNKLGRLGHQKHNALVYGTSGCVATVIHDAISNPTEVVKQRMQMHNSQHRSVLKCIAQVYREEGFRAFYRSYTTQLTMNIPFQSIHFITYEFFINQTNPERTYNPMAHMISGGIAGASAAAATTPLDVCKTLLNTEGRNRGMIDALKTVYRLAGPFGYFKGIQARVLYQMPAAAICWSTYEFFKYLLIDRLKIDHDKIPPPDKTSGLVGKNASKDVMSLSDKLSLRLVLPQASVSADTNTEVSGSGVTRSGPDNNEVLGLKPRELPVISGANLYGSLNLNTRHVDDSATTTRMRTGNFMDMRQS